MAFSAAVHRYYVLSKPGIIYANVLTALAGYLFAAKLDVRWFVLSSLVVGLALVIAAACSYNNYLDRDLDSHMQRTHDRGLITGTIKGWQALTFASLAAIVGLGLLAATQNMVTFVLITIALLDYVVLYGIGKRISVHGTLVGCIAGAIPLIAGYTAVSGHVDIMTLLLFALMVAWQMGHFYGIALFRLQDYQAAGLPVMPAVYGTRSTKVQAMMYMVLFIVCALVLLRQPSVNALIGSLLVLSGVLWLAKALLSYHQLTPDVWGKRVFLSSLLVMAAMSALLILNPIVNRLA